MRSVFGAVVAAVVLSLAVAIPDAHAQIGFSIGGGPSFVANDLPEEIDLDMGYHAKLGVNFQLPAIPIGIRAEALWNRWNVSDIDDAKLQSLSGSVNAVFRIPLPGISPYIIGGVGYYDTSFEVEDLEDFDTSETDFGLNGGVGLELNLPGIRAFIEARLHHILADDDSEFNRFVPVTVGLRL